MTLPAPTRIARPLAAFALAACLGGCAGTPAAAVDGAASPATRPVGGDRDAHGCLPAAGYAWCARERRCVRPWELAKAAGFENDAEGFARHCATAPARPAG